MSATYHVRIVNDYGTTYVGDLADVSECLPVSNIDNAHIYSRLGALDKARTLRELYLSTGYVAVVSTVMLTRTGKIRTVRV